jgi:hypothetical protein
MEARRPSPLPELPPYGNNAPPMVVRPDLRTSWHFLRRQFPSAFVVLSVAGILVRVLAHPDTALIAMVAALVIAATWAALVALNLALSRVVVADGRVTWRLVLRHGSFALDDVGGVTLHEERRLTGDAAIYVVVRRPDGRVLLHLSGKWWSWAALKLLMTALERRPDVRR